MQRDPAADYVIRVNVDEAIKRAGFPSRRQAAEAIHSHQNTLTRLANGKTDGIDFKTMIRLIVGLRCSPNDLFEIDVKDEEKRENAPTTDDE